jgi:hypothetical protein
VLSEYIAISRNYSHAMEILLEYYFQKKSKTAINLTEMFSHLLMSGKGKKLPVYLIWWWLILMVWILSHMANHVSNIYDVFIVKGKMTYCLRLIYTIDWECSIKFARRSFQRIRLHKTVWRIVVLKYMVYITRYCAVCWVIWYYLEKPTSKPDT